MTDRTFSVGTANMNGLKRILRIAQVVAKYADIIQVFFVSCSAQPAKHWEPVKEVVDGFSKVHSRKNIASGLY